MDKAYKSLKINNLVERLYFPDNSPYVNDKLNLLGYQVDKFEYFKKRYLVKILKDFFPIQIRNIGKKIKNMRREIIAEIIFKKIIIEKKRRTSEDAIIYNKNYEAKTSILLDFSDKLTGLEYLNQKIYILDLPIMTNNGSFIINGSYKVIVPQIIRSNGVCFSQSQDFKKEKEYYKLIVLPWTGLWLTFEFAIQKETLYRNESKSLHLKINQNKKINFVIFLKSLGFNNNLIFNIFGRKIWIKNIILQSIENKSYNKNIFLIVCEVFNKYKLESTKKSAFSKIKILYFQANYIYIYIPKNLRKIYYSDSVLKEKIKEEINSMLIHTLGGF